MPLFSIVLPVYNVADYIEASVRSVCLQSFRDFEVILVDDGSKDTSIDLAESVLTELKINYIVLRKENGGQSSARNAGIKASTGKWIICLDSDDCLHPQTLEIVAGLVDDSTIDVFAFNFIRVDSHQKQNYPQICEKVEMQKYSQTELANAFLLRKIQLIVPSLVMRRSLLIEGELLYDESCRFSEDQLFIWHMIFNIKQLCFVKYRLYYYLTRPNSIMAASSSEKILTGFKAFKTLDLEVKNMNFLVINFNFILPRWIIGTLHTSTKIFRYKEFCSLARELSYKRYVPLLRGFPDKRIVMSVSLLMFSKFAFYTVFRLI